MIAIGGGTGYLGWVCVGVGVIRIGDSKKKGSFFGRGGGRVGEGEREREKDASNNSYEWEGGNYLEWVDWGGWGR